MNRSESIAELSKAMAAFQKEVKQPEKSADNPFFKSKYVPLESVVDTINKFGPKHGLSFTQWPMVHENGRIGVATLLMHSSGEWIEYDPVFMKSEKDTAQGAGSVVSYLRRYALSAVFGITSDDDDDGNVATHSQKPPQKPTQRRQAPTKQQGGGITAEQMKALSETVQKAAQTTSLDVGKVFADAAKECGFPGKTSKDLTPQEADAVIKYLREWTQ